MGRGLALKCITLGFAGRDTIAHRYTPYSCAPHAACCCLAALITANDACVNMVTVAESRRRSALVGTACQRVLCSTAAAKVMAVSAQLRRRSRRFRAASGAAVDQRGHESKTRPKSEFCGAHTVVRAPSP